MVTVEFAQRLGAIATEVGQAVCAYINRRGHPIRIGVGTPRQTQIPLLELPRYGAERLSGIRCITATPHARPPQEASLTALIVQRLDALAILTLSGKGFQRRGGGATGYVAGAYLAHLLPDSAILASDAEDAENGHTPASSHWSVSPLQSLDALTKQDFLALVEGLEAEFRREFVARQVDATRDRVLVVGLQTDNVDRQTFEDGLTEVTRLVDTAGGEVLATLEQKRPRAHPQTAIGAGKVQELAVAVQTLGANLVVCDRDLTPAQARNLETRVGVRAIDRTELILDIFAQRAQSRAGKLQVELAQLEYLLPRLTGRGRAMSRLGGGIGTRGPGETKLETERRAIQRRMSRLQNEVDKLQAHRSRMRQQRQRQDVPAVAIVGYTNAGKSTLLNTLTNANIYAADRLFATLDPTTRRLSVPAPETEDPDALLLTDTVGFIRQLPPALMDAFRATLEEVTESDAILHLVDLSHPAWESQIASVTSLLAEMPISPGPMLVAFNKIDRADSAALARAREQFPEAAFLSAQERLGLESLRVKLGQLVRYAVAVA
ncbi:GTP-binding protein HflX [Rubidibacter lacunae KORDI 51-2]|uniref:GTPase HflX n=1 Tax=Rubidibacter lacunae KORDI 51-2 TaxID=582515 RepID=U5DR36_9CHRO|nr:GTP-binding protein HflX [Rubidibacter lacunae KORDI 51-2]